MADTPQQIQYDKDLAALNALSGVPRVKAKEALDLKYPMVAQLQYLGALRLHQVL